MAKVDGLRARSVNEAPVRGDGAYVLYWMIAQRRVRHNLGLDHALDRARSLGVPLLIFEGLRCDYRWASPRLHHAVLCGMRDNRARAAAAGVTYLPYVEPSVGDGEGLLAALAKQACCVVTDTFPTFFLPRMVRAAGAALSVRLEEVDGNGLVPLRLPDRSFTVAHSLRRWLHDRAPALLDRDAFPDPEPLKAYDLGGAVVPEEVTARWPSADLGTLLSPGGLDTLPVDHAVHPVPGVGGSDAGERRLARWMADGLPRYAEARDQPAEDVASGLSPYLHFGHVGAHEVVSALLDHEGWSPARLDPGFRAKNRGFWGMSEPAEAFLDEVLTWRELGYLDAWRRPEAHKTLSGNPAWARQTLADHAEDRRPVQYSLADLTEARTDDPLWNAAQRQLRHEGRIHNYLRMLWGKHVLAWSPTPEVAASRLIELNNRWALDGRNPNSYAGIFWTFGRFDRAWGPERPVFGKVRYMTSRSARAKLSLDPYLERWSA